MGRKELARLDIGAEIRKGKEKIKREDGGETKYHKWTILMAMPLKELRLYSPFRGHLLHRRGVVNDAKRKRKGKF